MQYNCGYHHVYFGGRVIDTEEGLAEVRPQALKDFNLPADFKLPEKFNTEFDEIRKSYRDGNSVIDILYINKDDIYIIANKSFHEFISHRGNGVILKSNDNGKTWKQLKESTAVFNSIVLYNDKVLAGSWHYSKEEKKYIGGIWEVDRKKGQVSAYIKEPVCATFMQVIGDNLYVGGGHNTVIHKINGKDIVATYPLKFNSDNINY
jgi:hypothetical protein